MMVLCKDIQENTLNVIDSENIDSAVYETITSDIKHIAVAAAGFGDFDYWQANNQIYVTDLCGIVTGVYNTIEAAARDMNDIPLYDIK